MPSDSSRLREQLARQERFLRELDVVEAAEQVIRNHHRAFLAGWVAEIDQELHHAQRYLAAARSGNYPSLIDVAEEQVRAVQRRATILRRICHEHDQACTRAQIAHDAGHHQLLGTISGLQRSILRIVQPPT